MTTERKFAGFMKDGSTTQVPPFRMREIPDGGLCLSAFLVISEANHPEAVLMGRLNPAAPWDHIGALDVDRIQAHSKGWMLPSSHLIMYESPQDAAKRIMKEQLSIEDNTVITISELKVVSEVYTPKRFQNLQSHWDIEFIFRVTLNGTSELPKSTAWTELKFVDVGKTLRSEMARSHEDILESTGFKFKDS